MFQGAKAYISMDSKINGQQDQWTARSTRSLHNKETFYGEVQPAGGYSSACPIYRVVEETGMVQVVRLREPFEHAVPWKRREVSISSVYRCLRDRMMKRSGGRGGWRRVSRVKGLDASTSTFVSRRYTGGVSRCLSFRTLVIRLGVWLSVPSYTRRA